MRSSHYCATVRPGAWQASQATRLSAHAPSTCPTVAILVVIVFLSRKKQHDIRRRNFAQPTVPEKIAFYRYVARCRAHRAVMFFRRRIAALSPQSREFDALFCNGCLAIILPSWLHVSEYRLYRRVCGKATAAWLTPSLSI